MAASRGWQGNLSEGDAPERLRVTMATASLFQVFAVNPILGRGLQPADEQPGRANVCVLSQALWQRRFGSDRNILGQEIVFDGQPRTAFEIVPALLGDTELTPMTMNWALSETLCYLTHLEVDGAVTRADGGEDAERWVPAR